MRAYVINLPRSPERRASMLEQVSRLELDHEFVDAVDGAALTAGERAELVDEEMVASIPWWLTPGAIGCALSHLRVYDRVLDDGWDAALVLEDDVELSAGLDHIASAVAAHLRGREVALLYFRSFGPCRLSSQDSVEIAGQARLMYPIELLPLATSSAYVITQAACEALIAANRPVRVTADTWSHFYDLGALEAVRCVVPRPVAMRKVFKSTMDYAGPASLRLRATSTIDRRRLFPLAQMLALGRHLVERRMSRLQVVPERSPIAMRRAA